MRKKHCSQKWYLFYHTVSVVLCLALIMGIIGPYHAKAVTQNRYIILVVDTSGVSDFIDTSTGEVVFSAVSPIDEVKQSAKNFAESLSMVEGANVAIVSYGDYAQIELPFTNSIETIKSSINGISTRKEGNRYSVSDDGSYTVILPGGSARIGVNLSGGGTDFYPKEFLLQVQ